MQRNLDDLELFYQLKKEVLLKYLQTYPYWEGTLVNFGNKEIAQLQDLILDDIKQRISEKWVYTHLKPIENIKLPRKDMLNILAKWTGFSDWDEFKVKKRAELVPENVLIEPVSKEISKEEQIKKVFASKRTKKIASITIVSLFVFVVAFFLFSEFILNKKEYSICFYNQYTQKKIAENNFSVLTTSKDERLVKQKTTDGCVRLFNDANSIDVFIQSPYYKDVTLTINLTDNERSIYLQPDDYAMMLRMCMNSEKDWEKRRSQLGNIIADDAEIIEVMYDDIGVEFLNKEEFIDKITIPIESTKTMEIIDIEYSEDKKMKILKFIQKDEH